MTCRVGVGPSLYCPPQTPGDYWIASAASVDGLGC